MQFFWGWPTNHIFWPYYDDVQHSAKWSARSLCQQLSDNCWKHTFSLPISTFSALGVYHVMRYINLRYLLTYLLYFDMDLCCVSQNDWLTGVGPAYQYWTVSAVGELAVQAAEMSWEVVCCICDYQRQHQHDRADRQADRWTEPQLATVATWPVCWHY